MNDRRILANPVGFIGFEKFIEASTKTNPNIKYPPFDIYKSGETQYVINIALAGFKKENIKVTVDKGVLEVTGKWETVDNKVVSPIFSGIAKRDFTNQFKLGEYVEVTGVSFDDGILKIELEKLIPEDLKPKVIEIK